MGKEGEGTDVHGNDAVGCTTFPTPKTVLSGSLLTNKSSDIPIVNYKAGM